jgi:GDP-4-dehydro-6-deoxy-D-mannose reductase
MRSALVTGGQGFIGRYLVDVLRRRGLNVRTLGRKRTAEASHIVLEETAWDSLALDRVLTEAVPDCIFHLAGTMQGTSTDLFRTNAGLTQSLLRALSRTSLEPLLVIAGSAAEYGSAIRDHEPIRETAVCAPVSPYGASKQVQTRLALAYAHATGARVLVARIFNPLGPDMPSHLAIADFARQIASVPCGRGTLRVGNLSVRRDMIDVEHVATLLCQLAANPHARGVVNVCSGQAPFLYELVQMLISGCGRKIDIEIDRARVRANELHTIVGSTDLLTQLDCQPPPTDFPAVIARIWQEMERRVARVS